MFEKFQAPINDILRDQGIERSVKLFTPPSPDLGDFCFVVNQVAGSKDPEQLAETLQPELEAIDGIASVSVFNAGNDKKKIMYLNFTMADTQKGALQSDRVREVLDKVLGETYGHLDVNRGNKVIVEHTSNNPISPIHVGNLRNSVQGDTYARLLRHSGYEVYTHFYVNDVGLQTGFVVVGYEVAVKELDIRPPIKIDVWCGQIYAIMNCLYTIQKLKRNGLTRGADVADDYVLRADEVSILQSAIDDEIASFEPRLAELTDLEERSDEEKSELKELKQRQNNLTDEKTDIDKYLQTFTDLQTRFGDLFTNLLDAVSEFDLHERVKRYLKAYETNSDERISSLFREVVDWVLSAFEWTLARYNIYFDQFDYESEITWSNLPTDIVDKLAQSDRTAVEGDAVRYHYSAEGMEEFMEEAGLSEEDMAIRGEIPPLQLRRSDGTALYTAKDIAYSIKKFENREPDKIYNVISSEQALSQFQMKLPLHDLGYTEYAANLYHYSYELVDLMGRVMSGRLAKYILADEYYDETIVRARIAKREADADRDIGLPSTDEEWQEEGEILRAVALASTRFPLIETVPHKQIELDLDRELDFRRNAGPFVQYAHARTNSLLQKVEREKGWTVDPDIDVSLLADFDIVEIFNHLDELDDRILLAVDSQDPSKVATWVYQLAQDFMKFYENYPVLKAEDEETGKARLTVVGAIQKGLQTGLEILGIPAASRL